VIRIQVNYVQRGIKNYVIIILFAFLERIIPLLYKVQVILCSLSVLPQRSEYFRYIPL